MERASIDELADFLIGQAEDAHAMTGCTAILAPAGAVCGIDIRGGSPGTRDTAGRGQDAIAKTVRPAHSLYDGDTVFTLASGRVETSQDALGVLAEKASAAAMLDAVRSAETYGEYLAFRDLAEGME